MKTYSDIEEYRTSEEAMTFAAGWLRAQRSGDVTSDFHMNLIALASQNPYEVLGIVMNLIDQVEDDEGMSEAIGLGPVDWLLQHASDDFRPIIMEARSKHSGFSEYTKAQASNPTDQARMRNRLNPEAQQDAT